MNIEKIIFSFFIVLAMTLNFGFFLGDIDNPAHHNVYELFAAIVVNLIATVLKFGDRHHQGAFHPLHARFHALDPAPQSRRQSLA